MDRPIGVGLLGCGTVGTGVARILLEGEPTLLEKTGLDIRLVCIAEPYPERAFVIKDTGERLKVAPELVTDDAEALIERDDVDIIVETIGGIEPAKTFILKALSAGKAVVTANKKVLAEHGEEIFRTAGEHGTSISFEASTGGGIPLIASVRDGLVANRIDSIVGILNGTTNYILTEMTVAGRPYADVLADAQQKGYAETPPTDDVGGFDAANKIAILSSLAYHRIFHVSQVHIEGIEGIRLEDIRQARELGYAVKLLAVSKRHKDALEMRVHPALVRVDTPLASVSGAYNAVVVHGDAVGHTMYYGYGAGQMPTASAVVADIVDAARGTSQLTFGALSFYKGNGADIPILPMDEVRTRHYARFLARDRRGVLGSIATILSNHDISMARVVQCTPLAADAPTETKAVVIVTHTACDANFRKAVSEIDASDLVSAPSTWMRVEDEEE